MTRRLEMIAAMIDMMALHLHILQCNLCSHRWWYHAWPQPKKCSRNSRKSCENPLISVNHCEICENIENSVGVICVICAGCFCILTIHDLIMAISWHFLILIRLGKCMWNIIIWNHWNPVIDSDRCDSLINLIMFDMFLKCVKFIKIYQRNQIIYDILDPYSFTYVYI